MKKTYTYLCIAAGILSLALAGAYMGYRCLFQPNVKDTSATLTLYGDESKDEVISKMTDSGILISDRTFRLLSDWKLDRIKAGCYRFKESADNRYIINSIRMGWQTPTTITVSGKIRGIAKLSSILSGQLLADSTALDNAFRKYGNGKDELTALSHLIPNTYEVYWTITPEELIQRFEKEYVSFWNDERKSKAERMGLTPEEVSILASIVGEESNVEEELPVIAGVYFNRLRKGIPLQADPTVKFALKDQNIKRILRKHLETDSPYNTYRKTGLPPGPIVVPSSTEIDAVLNYREHNYLYFCADPSFNGTHRFATTLREHNRNAAEYHQALNRMKIN